jgi:GntR family transcriptional regulator, transcriptional repressor for pyruvate dehydrogenase complex
MRPYVGREWTGWGVRPRKVEEIIEELRDRVKAERYRSGERLPPERELCAEMDVARATLRHALGSLEEGGYLERRLGSKGGWFVTDLTIPATRWVERMRLNAGELQDILDYRVAVESQAASLAAGRRSVSQLEEMKAAVRRLKALAAVQRIGPGTAARLRMADTDLHEAIARACGSERLAKAVKSSRAELFGWQRRSVYEEIAVALVEDHEAIVKAIADEDSALASKAMREHITRGGDRVKLWLSNETQDVADGSA